MSCSLRSLARLSARPSLATALIALLATSSAQAAPGAPPTHWYVDAGADCAAGRGSEELPFCTISAAVAAAVEGDTILIAPGRYAEGLVLEEDLTLIGTGGAEATIIDRDSLGRVVEVRGAPTLKLIGLTLTGGSDPRGGSGLYIDVAPGAGVTLLRSEVSGNRCDAPPSEDALGGGIHVRGGALSVVESTVRSNSAVAVSGGRSYGAGIHAAAATVTIRSSLLHENLLYASAEGFGEGSGIYGDPASSLRIENVTVAWNQSQGTQSSAVKAMGHLSMTSSIVWRNRASLTTSPAAPSVDAALGRVDFSNIQRGWSGEGTGNVRSDPKFASPFGFSFRLLPDSPCVDSGDPAARSLGFDLAGTPRLLDGDLDRALRIDMGAYEFGHVTLRVDGEPIPGHSLKLSCDGTDGLEAILAVGFQPAHILLAPFGTVYFDLSGPVWLRRLGQLPRSPPLAIPPTAPVPFDFVLQVLAFDPARGGVGNVSNPVFLTTE